jgi:LPPG:FO 2-phospho-L-lactate transferase
MARALRSVLDPDQLTVVVNVGDDTERYSVRVSPDPDTVLYTLADVEGQHGWGRRDDTFATMEELARLGVDTSFALGDKDLAVCMYRTQQLESGEPLSAVTSRLVRVFGIGCDLLPATDDPLETFVQIGSGSWLSFQEYFVDRRHRDDVQAVAYHGAPQALAAPGVVDAITNAETLVIAPSNPPLSIWPILAIDSIREAVALHQQRVAVSPLFGGTPLKGPADKVMAGVGLSTGTRGVLEAYDGLIDVLYVDEADSNDVPIGDTFDVVVIAANTLLTGDDRGAAFAARLLDLELQ